MKFKDYSLRWDASPGEGLVSDGEWHEIKNLLSLTPREYEVCRRFFMGMNRSDTAKDLGLSSSTVRQYNEQLHFKLGVTCRVDLVLRIIQVRDYLSEQKLTDRKTLD